jgi:ectoine hydroxylase-related dioxygenase (phytanoyl-CoA dioxygenase family)
MKHLTQIVTTAKQASDVIPGQHTFGVDGIEIRRSVLNVEDIEAVQAEVTIDHPMLRRSGIRNLEKKFSSISRVTQADSVLAIATSLLGRRPRLVRALFFDKTPTRNWFVAWHQDRTVTLNRRVPLEGWDLWSQKDGVHHVQPPRDVLDRMVTIRLHLDPADRHAGCLSVIPGSHRHGVLTTTEIRGFVASSQARYCVVNAGDAVVMHPLILHSSLRSRSSSHRRVVHLEYSCYELPPGVAWA